MILDAEIISCEPKVIANNIPDIIRKSVSDAPMVDRNSLIFLDEILMDVMLEREYTFDHKLKRG